MEVVKAPDPKLRIKTKPVKKVNNGLLNILTQMVKLTKTFKDPQGVGLASTQIGLDESFFVAKDDDPPVFGRETQDFDGELSRTTEPAGGFIKVINPKVLSSSKKTKKYFEGCLSVPNMWGEVQRHLSVKVNYQDESGKTITKSLQGVLAWIFQHEIDHLNGILFSDRVLQQKGRFYKFTGKDKTGTDTFEEIALP